ncbi:uncharacterized protein LOC144103727 [Amblyomma americanum]
MGGAASKDVADQTTGLTGKDRRHIRDIWHTFTTQHEDYGEILFTSLFFRHPDYQQLFTHFRDRPLGSLKGAPKFRAHASIVGGHITSMVNALDTPKVLLGVVEKNARFHAKMISNVRPEHFVDLGRVIIEVLRANYEELMTPEVVRAWEKLFQLMNEKNVSVFTAEQASTNASDSYKLQCMSTTAVMARGNASPKATDHQRRYSQGPPRTSEKSSRPVKSPESDVPVDRGREARSPVEGELHRDKGQHRKSVASERTAPKPAAVPNGVGPSTAATAQGQPHVMSPTDKEQRRKSAAPGKTHPRATKAEDNAVAEGAEHIHSPEQPQAKGKEAVQKPKASDKSSHH